MKLLNLGAGAIRPPDPWLNLDNLHASLPLGSPERTALDREPNYLNHDVSCGYLPFDDGTFDGILASHVIEHFDAQEAAKLMRNCFYALKPRGVLMVSVPDASYFRRVAAEDTPENALRLFGEPIHLPDGENTFCGYALWNRWHKAILTEDALWCYFVRAGFKPGHIFRVNPMASPESEPNDATAAMRLVLNRGKFSLVMSGVKT
jgi:predicted SAM-dependent methyltransferase